MALEGLNCDADSVLGGFFPAEPGSTGQLVGIHGAGQVSTAICRAHRNTDALLMPVAIVATPANKPTIAAPAANHFWQRVSTRNLRISIR